MSKDQIREKISDMRVAVTSRNDGKLELNSINLKQLLILCLYADYSMADIYKKIIPEIYHSIKENADNKLSSKQKKEVVNTLNLLGDLEASEQQHQNVYAELGRVRQQIANQNQEQQAPLIPTATLYGRDLG